MIVQSTICLLALLLLLPMTGVGPSLGIKMTTSFGKRKNKLVFATLKGLKIKVLSLGFYIKVALP